MSEVKHVKVFLGADHGGFEMKNQIKAHLLEKGYDVADFGTHSKDAVDFPDYAFLVTQAISGNHAGGGNAVGIIVDSIGQGSAVVANKVKGIRAVVAMDAFSVKSSREHTNANVLCLGGAWLGPGLAKDLVDLWLNTPYAGGRHQRRLDKITEIENRTMKVV
ncbi:ribose 5-phosphate isomerase B [Myxococcota bacterium]|nr:ribose 5-phosphate isomerase B [Myxococcota bacterium]MBU1380235.1 ribose 5-phosphate isomerase B [Myxococcota bacterium]MBU1499101.1 ribose 5-phosphate isomerase B [Myxococcota bacterium]